MLDACAAPGGKNADLVGVGGADVVAVDPKTRIVTRVAGTGTRTRPDGSDRGDGGPAHRATLSDPLGLDVDDDGSLWIADASASRVRFVNRGTGSVSPIPGLSRGQSAAAT